VGGWLEGHSATAAAGKLRGSGAGYLPEEDDGRVSGFWWARKTKLGRARWQADEKRNG
jgi:hypothetical protein